MIGLLIIGVIAFFLLRDGRVGPLSIDRSGAPGRGPGCWRHRDPEALLAERLASGDISADEYREGVASLREV